MLDYKRIATAEKRLKSLTTVEKRKRRLKSLTVTFNPRT